MPRQYYVKIKWRHVKIYQCECHKLYIYNTYIHSPKDPAFTDTNKC